MSILLDTHTLFWWGKDSSELSAAARAAILDPNAVVYISSASIMEIGIKVANGKWPEAKPLIGSFHSLFADWEFEELSITHIHAMLAGTMSASLRDPFDSMLAAQATLENLTLVTRDIRLLTFLGPRALW
jgi:PIN domain nuclease of toxin-antitoxin system